MRAFLRHSRLFPTLVLLAWAVLGAGQARAESLFKAETLADGTLYSDQVARRKGDLITIMVQESTTITDTQKTELKRENEINAHVNLVPGMKETPSSTGSSSVGKLPGLEITSLKDFKGDGSYSASGNVQTAITGRVIDVLDNGNLVVEGRRQLKVGNDTKTILVTGIIRSADISAQNQVYSQKMHNFEVSIVGEGPLARSQQEGWVARLMDVIWPF